MSNPLISIQTLYLFDESLFDEFVVPAALSKDDIIAGILGECDELQLVWANPVTAKAMIGSWSRRRLPNWERYLKAFQFEYSVGDNYDMTEIYEGEDEQHNTSNQTYSSDRTGSTSNTKNGYNTGSQTTSSGQSTKEGSKGGQDTSTDGHLNQYYKKTRKGNTGVATYQDMVDKELDIAVKYDLAGMIIEEFRDHFCVVLY